MGLFKKVFRVMRIRASQLFADFKESGIFTEMRGPDCELNGIASVESCSLKDIVFISGKKYLTALGERKPGLAVVPLDMAQELEKRGLKTLFLSPNVNLAHALLKQKYAEHDFSDTGWPRIHPSAVIHESVKVPQSARIEPTAVIEKDVKIGERVVVGAGSVLERGVIIGEDTIIHPRVFIGHNCIIGKKVIIHPGSIIGSEGFGFAKDAKGRNYRIPQTGRVRIGDRVVIGALTAIDRATYEETYVSEGTATDNFCHIAHNVYLDEDIIILPFSGIAGSSKVGKRVIIGGGALISDHIEIADDVSLLHSAIVIQDIKDAGAYAGFPLQLLPRHMRGLKLLESLPEMYKSLKKLEKTIYEKKEEGSASS